MPEYIDIDGTIHKIAETGVEGTFSTDNLYYITICGKVSHDGEVAVRKARPFASTKENCECTWMEILRQLE